MNKIIILFIVICFANQAQAAQVIRKNATWRNDAFYIDVSVSIKGNKQDILRIFTDYKNLKRINPKITSSKIIRQNKNKTKVRTVTKDCILFFCQEIINVQEVEIKDSTITAITLPKESNLKKGIMKWQISDTKDGVIIDYIAEIEPDFFIPPAIIRVFIDEIILRETTQTIEIVEKLAASQKQS